MVTNPTVDDYINSLPAWQKKICQTIRSLVHEADPDIAEEIKFTERPYFTLSGNVCALMATKDHVNVFIYDPIVADPTGLINQGHDNSTARSIQLYENETVDKKAFIKLIRGVASNNRQGGWRKLIKG